MREFRELPSREEKEQRVELLGGLVDFLREKWSAPTAACRRRLSLGCLAHTGAGCRELEMPSVIFSVTGSAPELTHSPIKFRIVRLHRQPPLPHHRFSIVWVCGRRLVVPSPVGRVRTYHRPHRQLR